MMELRGRGAGGCPLGLKHNIHIHYLEVKGDDAPQQLVMFVHLVGLCFPPLQMVCLACKYILNCLLNECLLTKFYFSQYIASITLVCLLYLPVLN